LVKNIQNLKDWHSFKIQTLRTQQILITFQEAGHLIPMICIESKQALKINLAKLNTKLKAAIIMS
jgi:hypothetical protein